MLRILNIIQHYNKKYNAFSKIPWWTVKISANRIYIVFIVNNAQLFFLNCTMLQKYIKHQKFWRDFGFWMVLYIEAVKGGVYGKFT